MFLAAWLPRMRFQRAIRIIVLILFQMTMEYLNLRHRTGDAVLRQQIQPHLRQ